MLNLLKSELLRVFSGYATLGIASFVVVVPALLVTMGPSLDGLTALSDAGASHAFYGVSLSTALVGAYLGTYSVTREFYYRSMSRSLVVGSLRQVFVAKVVAVAVGSAALCLLGTTIWALVSSLVLPRHGREFTFDSGVWAVVSASLFGSLAGSALGVGLGWVIRNYYATTAIVLLVPLVVELPLLTTAPAVERFLPVGALVGSASLGVEGMLPWWAGALVVVGWASLLVLAGTVAAQRREL